MKRETAQMLESKMNFIKAVEAMLAEDQRSNQVDSLSYRVTLHDEEGCWYDEYIDIIFQNGYVRTILATGNSNGANLKAIVREIY